MEDRIFEMLQRLQDSVNTTNIQVVESKTKLEAIHEQVKKTNGRVTVNESKIESLNGFRTKLYAYATAVSIIFGVVAKLIL